jgi:FkbM family methyltransferase
MKLGHSIKLKATQPYLERVIYNRSYHDENVYFLRRFISKDSVILDIGANIGLVSCAYASLLKEFSPNIYAVEAVERNHFQLKKNIELNGFKCIKPVHLAFGKESGELVFKLPSSEFTGNAVGMNVLSDKDRAYFNANHTYEEVVTLTTLDLWTQEERIPHCDYIKIDVEGAEIDVLKGGLNFISRTRPLIQCEFNRYWVEQQGLRLSNYLDFFTPLNYECFVDKGNSYLRYVSGEESFSLIDLLFVPKEKLNIFS